MRSALTLFEQLPDEPLVPFVASRKCKREYTATGLHSAHLTARHAGDGGFTRRIVTLNLLARRLPEPDASRVRSRVETLSELVEDDECLRRVHVRWGDAPQAD